MLGSEKDCENCASFKDEVKLDVGNIDNLKLWSLVYDQQIVGFNGAVALKLDVVLSVIDLLDIPENKKLESLTIVKECWTYFNNKAVEDNERQQQLQENSEVKTKNIKRKLEK